MGQLWAHCLAGAATELVSGARRWLIPDNSSGENQLLVPERPGCNNVLGGWGRQALGMRFFRPRQQAFAAGITINFSFQMKRLRLRVET